MGIEEFVQQRCGVHLGAAVLPAEVEDGDEEGQFEDARTDGVGALQAELGAVLVGLEGRLLGELAGVESRLQGEIRGVQRELQQGQREMGELLLSSLRSWLNARVEQLLDEDVQWKRCQVDELGARLGQQIGQLGEKFGKFEDELMGELSGQEEVMHEWFGREFVKLGDVVNHNTF